MALISGFIELTSNTFSRYWTIQMLIHLSSHFGGSSPILSPTLLFNAYRSLSVSLEVLPELLWLQEIFPLLHEFCHGPYMIALEKPCSFAVLVTEALAIRAPTFILIYNMSTLFVIYVYRTLHAPATLKYALVTLKYAPTTLKYASTTLKHAPATLKYAPTTLKHAPVTLKYVPTTLKHAPATLKHAPATLKYASTTLKYAPSTLKHVSATLKHAPTTVKHVPASL